MSAEKLAAFNESWNAMAQPALRANPQLAMSFMQALWLPWAAPKASLNSASRQIGNATSGIAAKDMAPVHRLAVANAKRLGCTKLR
jgi:hypothetical protein